MNRILTMILILWCVAAAEKADAQSLWVQPMVNSVSGDSLFATIAALQPMNRVNAANSMVLANYLKSRLQDYNVDTVFFQYFKANTPPNVVAIRYGSLYPGEYYVIGAHYDAVISGAGADDNASGTAAVIEMARVMKDYTTDRSLILVLFSAEEVGLWGSKAFADSAVKYFNMLGMINLDMIAYSHNFLDSSVSVCYKYLSSGLLSTYINATTILVPELQIAPDSTSVVLYSSDHAPFWQKLIPALFLIENSNYYGGAFNPYYHSYADTIGRGANSKWLAEKITRSAVGTLLWILNPAPASSPLPVSLIGWRGEFTDHQTVDLTWSTATEYNNSRFVLQRADENHTFQTIGTIPGAGTTSTVHHYQFTDRNPGHPWSRYRLVQIDYDGTESWFPVLEIRTCRKQQLEIQKAVSVHRCIELTVGRNPDLPLVAELFTMGGVPVSKSIIEGHETPITIRLAAPKSPGLCVVRISDGIHSVSKRVLVFPE